MPEARYAVFAHDGHVSEIGMTYAANFDGWLPAHAKTLADAPVLERHRQTFDPRTGLGGVDISVTLA